MRAVATTLERAARRSMDLVARYGGEEFAVVLPETGILAAEQVADRIHSKLTALAIAHPAARASDIITVSIGIAIVLPQASSSPNELIASADAALYQAKEAGRNQTKVAVEEKKSS